MQLLSRFLQRFPRAVARLNYRYRRSRLRNWIFSIKAGKRIKQFAFNNERFVVFLVPGDNLVNGGIMSIFSIASETQGLLAKDGVGVAICTPPCEPRILRYTKFENDIEILAFADLLPRFPSGSSVLVHVPELFTQKYASDCMFVYEERPDLKWRFNILLQNIDLIPKRSAVERLQQLGPTTATTAHKAYATEETAQRIGCPVHYLSTWICPEAYGRVQYTQKKKLVMISPDEHPAKNEILAEISRALPDHRIIEIRNIEYKKYRLVARNAKFTFTFGEGLDGYFIEAIFYGGIAMAIFNDRFFTDEYKSLDGVFPDSEQAALHVATFLKATDRESSYQTIADRQYAVAAKNYVRAEYLENIKTFYDVYFSPSISAPDKHL